MLIGYHFTGKASPFLSFGNLSTSVAYSCKKKGPLATGTHSSDKGGVLSGFMQIPEILSNLTRNKGVYKNNFGNFISAI